MVCVWKDLFLNGLENLETENSETIFSELSISNNKWTIAFTYRSPKSLKKAIFFDKLTKYLAIAVNNFDKI